VAAPDTAGAQAALFAREKDRVGEVGRSSLTALRSALAGRGMLGGGAEAKGTRDVITAGMRELGETGREQTIQEANRQNQWARTGYEGALQQRGQDIAARSSDMARESAQSEAAQQRAFEMDRLRFMANQGAQQQRQGAMQSLISRLY
jgi:hypothetical protein